MHRFAIHSVLVALLSTGFALADEIGVGIVTANGDFLLNGSRVSGNATLTEGTVIQTTDAPSRLRLNSGARFDLGHAAKAIVHNNRVVLDNGSGALWGAPGFEIEAGFFRLQPVTSQSSGYVRRQRSGAVQVQSLEGSIRVYNGRGTLLAQVLPGAALEFQAGLEGAGAPSNFLGCLLEKEDKWVIYDQTTRIVVELRGSGFEQEWGNRVQVTGTTDESVESEVAAQVVDVTTLTRFGTGGCESVAQAIGAELPPGPPPAPPRQPQPAGGGMSAGTKVLIISGIGAGTGTGAYFATRGDDRSN